MQQKQKWGLVQGGGWICIANTLQSPYSVLSSKAIVPESPQLWIPLCRISPLCAYPALQALQAGLTTEWKPAICGAQLAILKDLMAVIVVVCELLTLFGA